MYTDNRFLQFFKNKGAAINVLLYIHFRAGFPLCLLKIVIIAIIIITVIHST